MGSNVGRPCSRGRDSLMGQEAVHWGGPGTESLQSQVRWIEHSCELKADR